MAVNIVNVTGIEGKTKTGTVPDTLTSIFGTITTSQVYKINTVVISNITGDTVTDISVVINDGTADKYIASTVSVPADATLIVSSKDTAFYLEPGYSLKLLASAASALDYSISYELITDA